MSKKRPGGFIGASGIRKPSLTVESQNSGVWSLDEQNAAAVAGDWGNSSHQNYIIRRSLRFNGWQDQPYLTRTWSTSPRGAGKIMTYSFWVKRTYIGVDQHVMSSAGPNHPGGADISYMGFTADDKFQFYHYPNGGSNYFMMRPNRYMRDVSAWYHIVIATDTNAINNPYDRCRIWINGEEQTEWDSNTVPPVQGIATYYTSTRPQVIGQEDGRWRYPFNGYISEFHCIDGEQLPASAFGYFDYNGIWQPKKYTGGYGVNGYYLPFDPERYGDTASTTTIGYDKSGNGANFTANSFTIDTTTAAYTMDLMSDAPCSGSPLDDTGLGGQLVSNYAVFNENDSSYSAHSDTIDGNLRWAGVYGTTNGHPIRSTVWVPPTGKYYVETTNLTWAGAGNSCMLGWTSSKQQLSGTVVGAFNGNLTPWIGVDASAFNGTVRFNSSGVSASLANSTNVWSTTYTSGTLVKMAIDFDAGKFWVGGDGFWYNSGNPAAGTNPTSTFTPGSDEWTFFGEYVASSDNSNRSTAVVNFGQRKFVNQAPSGFKCLCTTNIPNQVIDNPAKHFNIVGYGGTANGRSVTGVGFKPDLVIIKTRGPSAHHSGVYDSVRGPLKALSTSRVSDVTENNDSTGLVSFDNDGFSFNGAGFYDVNFAGENLVAWCWKAGNGVTSTNTAGAITSTVSLNAEAGFSIVSYAGTGSNSTVGHGLKDVNGVDKAPEFILWKARDDMYNWDIYHKDQGYTNTFIFTTAFGRNVLHTGVTSTTMPSTNSYTGGSGNGKRMIAYCFRSIPGFSKFGQYVGTGNGNPDGTFVYTGFRPKFVLFKPVSGTAWNWNEWDTFRNPYNDMTKYIAWNLGDTEGTGSGYYDYYSNGFKPRSSFNNDNGVAYMYIAFAENPFKYARAR